MQVKIVAISILIIIYIPMHMLAQDAKYTDVVDIDALKTKLITHASTTNSIESNFIQEKHLWMLDEVLISKGNFLFKKENSVKWQYLSPIKYTIIIFNGVFTIVNNKKVSTYNTDSNPMFSEINKMIVTAIRGDFIDNKDFKSEFLENNKNYLAKLSPTNNQVSTMLKTIEIYFNKQNMQVVKIIFREPGDDFTLITFQNKKLNSVISDDRFQIETR